MSALLFLDRLWSKKYASTSAAEVGIDNSILSIYDGLLETTEICID
jgi:hypothetical protein